jgi:O-antigen chain-terminating methyltransferase
MTAATTHGSGPASDERTRALEAQVRELAEQVAELRAKVEGSGPRFAALYADFTDEFRGTSDEVTAKLAGYLPDVRRLVEGAGEGVRVVDIGSGRGEWLGLLQDAGVNVAGVDVNPAFVRAGRARGLNMVDGDAVTYLRRPAEPLTRLGHGVSRYRAPGRRDTARRSGSGP